MSVWTCKRCHNFMPSNDQKYTIFGNSPCCERCYSEVTAKIEKTNQLHIPSETKPVDEYGKPENALEEANRLIYGDRQEQYGNAHENFTRIARLWFEVLEGCVVNGELRITAEAVALCLLQLKVARAIHDVNENRPIKHDTIVDLAGYAGVIAKIQEGT